MFAGKIIGYDISDSACQISYYSEEQQEPVTYEASPESFQIPLVLATKNDQWAFGIDAKRMEILHDGKLVSELLTKSMDREKVELDGTTYEAVWLLSKFVGMSLENFKDMEAIVFTVPKLNNVIAQILRGVAAHMGVDKKNIYVQDYRESFCNYMFYQPKELWQYDAAVFYCDKSEVSASMLKRVPCAPQYSHKTFVCVEDVASTRQDVMDTIYPLLHGEKAVEADARFKIFIQNVFDQKVVSSVFLTGEGFDNNWYPESLKVLCNGRRGFLGNNLYSKGACYTAFKRIAGGDGNLVYIDENKLTMQISMKIGQDSNSYIMPLIPWGSHWYEADQAWEFVLEDTEDIEIYVESIHVGEHESVFISLDGMPERTSYSNKIELRVVPVDAEHFKIVVSDLGFGEFYESTGFVTETIVQLGGSHGQHHIV